MIDQDNFNLIVGGFSIVMTNGQLEINNCLFESDDEDPTYALVREINRLHKMYVDPEFD